MQLKGGQKKYKMIRINKKKIKSWPWRSKISLLPHYKKPPGIVDKKCQKYITYQTNIDKIGSRLQKIKEKLEEKC